MSLLRVVTRQNSARGRGTIAAVCRPECMLIAVDLAFTATPQGARLVTDKTTALLQLRCTHAVRVCDACVLLTGPAAAALVSFQPLPEGTHGLELLVGWEEGYRGAVTVDLETSRCAPACTSARGMLRQQQLPLQQMSVQL